MPKQKTHKSALRRFKITARGKVLHRSAFGRHLRRKKSASQIRRFRTSRPVSDKMTRKIKRLMALA